MGRTSSRSSTASRRRSTTSSPSSRPTTSAVRLATRSAGITSAPPRSGEVDGRLQNGITCSSFFVGGSFRQHVRLRTEQILLTQRGKVALVVDLDQLRGAQL